MSQSSHSTPLPLSASQGGRTNDDSDFETENSTIALVSREITWMPSPSRAAVSFPRIFSTPSFRDEAVWLFMADYVQAPQNGWVHGHLECLPSLLKDAPQNSCISHSVHAVAHQYLYNLKGQQLNRSRAVECYTQSLKCIHQALESPRERLSDTTLLAVWLVGLFEVSNPQIQLVCFTKHICYFLAPQWRH